MADEIIQVMGFDASGAIANIRALNKSLDELYNNLNKVANAAGGKGLSQVANDLPKISNGANNAKNNVNSLNKSLAQISKIVKTQLIVRAFSQISGAIRSSINEAKDFQLAVAEISTLTTQGTDGIANELKVTAESFGFDILDLAEAKYQLLSNQVEGAQTNTEAFTAALKLARATNTDVTSSINLISSVLNAFGKNASEAEEVAGSLFTLIEQGRVRASELASALGTVLPFAEQLGVKFEEVAASLAVITRQGVKFNVALTQQRGIFNKLLKPSTALQKVYQNLGVTDAQEGIRAFGGLIPFLRAINNEAQNNIAIQSQLFNNVRGLAGVLNTFANNGEDVNRVLAQFGFGAESVEKLNTAFQKVNQTDAANFERQVAALKNSLLDIGEQALPVVNDALSFFNNAIAGVSQNLGIVVGAFGGSLAVISSFQFLLGASAASASGLALVLGGPVLATVGAIAAGAAGIALAVKAVSDFNNRLRPEAIANARKALAEYKTEVANISKAADATSQDLDILDSNIAGISRTIRAATAGLTQDFATSTAKFASTNKSLLDDLLKARETFYDKIVDKAQKSEDKITDIEKKQADIRKQISDAEFDKSLTGRDAITKAFLQAKRIEEQVQIGKNLINQGEIEKGVDLLEDQLKDINKAVSQAEGTGNAAAITKSQNARLAVLKLIDQALTRQKQTEQENQKAAADGVVEAKAQLDVFKQQVETIKDLNEQLADPSLTPEQRENITKQLTDAVGQLQKTGGLNLDEKALARQLGLENLAKNIEDRLSNITIDISANADALQAKIDAIAPQLLLTVPLDILVEAKDLGLIDSINISNPAKSLDDASKNLNKELDKANEAAKTIDQKLKDANANLKLAGKTLLGSVEFADPQQAKNAADFIQKIVDAGNGLPADKLKLLQSFFEEGIKSGDIEVVNTQELEAGNRLLERARDLSIELGALRSQDDPTRTENLRDLAGGLGNLEKAAQDAGVLASSATVSAQSLGEAADSTLTINSTAGSLQTNYGTWADRVKKAADDMERFNKAAANTPPPPAAPAAPAPQNNMFGGFMRRLAKGGMMNYLNSGGFAPRGTDTVPAMLSPGEFVVNARAARKFASTLVAMNAGATAYRAEGGSVINNSSQIGTINIVDSNDPRTTARAVIAEQRREFRRKASPRYR